MHLGQIKHDGHVIAAIFEGNSARPIPAHTICDLINRADAEMISLPELASRLASRHSVAATPLIPLYPAEVWHRAAPTKPARRFAITRRLNWIRGRVKACTRMCIARRGRRFFQRHGARVRGTGQQIGIRADSKFTAPEPELAAVLGKRGRIVGYTLANDVSAWDIERENALYLPQSKVYTACCALGPVMVTTDELTDPYNLQMTCEILRGMKCDFRGRLPRPNCIGRLRILWSI